LFVFLLVLAGCGVRRSELGEIVTDLPKASAMPTRPVEIVKPADGTPTTTEPVPAGAAQSPPNDAAK
jgi:hypothetical protein